MRRYINIFSTPEKGPVGDLVSAPVYGWAAPNLPLAATENAVIAIGQNAFLQLERQNIFAI